MLSSPPAHRPSERTGGRRGVPADILGFEHPGPPSANLAFSPRASLGRLLSTGELRDQRVPRLLELFYASNMGFGSNRCSGQPLGGKIAHICGKLGLKASDLASQLLANLDRLTALDQIDWVQSGGTTLSCLLGAEHISASHQNNRQLAGINTRLLAPPQGVQSDRLKVGLGCSVIGDKSALTLAAEDKSLLLQ